MRRASHILLAAGLFACGGSGEAAPEDPSATAGGEIL